MSQSRTCVLVVAAGAPWESAALTAIAARPALVVLKRCVDITDLLATAATGQAQVAVVSLDAPGLDATAVGQLQRQQVGVVAIAPARDDVADRAARLGVRTVLPDQAIHQLADAVLASARQEEPPTVPGEVSPGGTGRAVAVWGPNGAPGRTTVALGVAGELARRGVDPLVLDVDPWGGAVAQHLGVLDEVSGLLSCARLSATGELAARFSSLQRRVGGLRVVTGLPRADRWVELRAGAVEQMVGLGRRQGPVVIDTGFSLEEDPAAEYAARPGRNGMTLEALAAADVVVVVGAADPVGLSRLARGLAELRESTGVGPVHVVVNRWRNRLGWSEADVAGLLAGFGRPAGLHFLPDDRDAVDRALISGRTLAESGDSALGRALAALVDALAPGGGAPVRRRTAGRARRR